MSVMSNPLSSPDASIGLSCGLGHHSLRMPTNSRRAGPATARFYQGSHALSPVWRKGGDYKKLKADEKIISPVCSESVESLLQR